MGSVQSSSGLFGGSSDGGDGVGPGPEIGCSTKCGPPSAVATDCPSGPACTQWVTENPGETRVFNVFNDPTVALGEEIPTGNLDICSELIDSNYKEKVNCPTTGEWSGPILTSTSCSYNDFDTSTTCACTGGGGIRGGKVTCKRTAYLGDPASCSIINALTSPASNPGTNNKAGLAPLLTNMEGNAFTCDPSYQNFGSGPDGSSSGACTVPMTAYCKWEGTWSSTGPDGNPTDPQAWAQNGSCSGFLTKAAAANTPQSIAAAGSLAQSLLADALVGGGLTDTSDLGKARYISNLLAFGQQYSIALDDTLNGACSTLTRKDVQLAATNSSVAPDATVQQLVNSNIVKACGCHLPDSQYDYLPVTESNTHACDPLCVLSGAIPYSMEIDGKLEPVACLSTNCVIDDVTIDFINSSSGPINFSNVCAGCSTSSSSSLGDAFSELFDSSSRTLSQTPSRSSSGASSSKGCSLSGNSSKAALGASGNGACQCYLSDVIVTSNNSKIQGLNFSNNCGSCFIWNPNDPGNPQCVNCSTLEPLDDCQGGGGGGGGGLGWAFRLSQYLATLDGKLVTGALLALLVVAVIIVGLVQRKNGNGHWWVTVALGLATIATLVLTGIYTIKHAT